VTPGAGKCVDTEPDCPTLVLTFFCATNELIMRICPKSCGICSKTLTLSLPAVQTQWFSQYQTFQRLVRSSHTLANWILNNFWPTESIFNHFSVFLKTLNALCVCLHYKHPRSMKRVIRSDKQITSVFHVKSQKCDFGAEPRCRLFATSAGKELIQTSILR
jgi:hypothetical protein